MSRTFQQTKDIIARNIDHRILLGGGRNLDFKTEETSVFGQTILVQEKLEQLLKESYSRIYILKLITDGVVLWV